MPKLALVPKMASMSSIVFGLMPPTEQHLLRRNGIDCCFFLRCFSFDLGLRLSFGFDLRLSFRNGLSIRIDFASASFFGSPPSSVPSTSLRATPTADAGTLVGIARSLGSSIFEGSGGSGSLSLLLSSLSFGLRIVRYCASERTQ